MKTPYVIAEAGVNFYDTAKTKELGSMPLSFRHIKQERLLLRILPHIGI